MSLLTPTVLLAELRSLDSRNALAFAFKVDLLSQDTLSGTLLLLGDDWQAINAQLSFDNARLIFKAHALERAGMPATISDTALLAILQKFRSDLGGDLPLSSWDIPPHPVRNDAAREALRFWQGPKEKELRQLSPDQRKSLMDSIIAFDGLPKVPSDSSKSSVELLRQGFMKDLYVAGCMLLEALESPEKKDQRIFDTLCFLGHSYSFTWDKRRSAVNSSLALSTPSALISQEDRKYMRKHGSRASSNRSFSPRGRYNRGGRSSGRGRGGSSSGSPHYSPRSSSAS
ncbi:MAG: hypothetical protein GY847_34950, partial [Proteobacteria bacterium]|nr:hypothetical protein [Pseudomonadota bacterium]